MEPLAAVEEQILGRLGEAESVFCFLDYDGTLAPLAPTPDQALPLPGTTPLLRELAVTPGTRVALVSGRPIADVQRFLDVPGVYYVGIHGLEVRAPGGETELAEGVSLVRAVLPGLRRQIEKSLAGRPGMLIEDKGVALACHYRLASQADAVIVRQTLADAVDAYQEKGVSLTLAHGHEVTEIRPTGANKGKTGRSRSATPDPTPQRTNVALSHARRRKFLALGIDNMQRRGRGGWWWWRGWIGSHP